MMGIMALGLLLVTGGIAVIVVVALVMVLYYRDKE